MKKIILALLLLISSTAFADRVDALRTAPPDQYCGVVTNFFYQGIQARVGNIPREVKQLPDDLLKKYYAGADFKVPNDAIYFELYDKLTDQEKTFMKKYIFQGWDEADKIVKRIKLESREPVEEVFDSDEQTKMAQAFFESCVEDRVRTQMNNKETENDLHKSASSESLDPKSNKYHQRFYCEEVAVAAYNKCMGK